MPQYVYRCLNDKGRDPPCEEERTAFLMTIPKDGPPQLLPDACPFCHGTMRLVVGRGVIARFGDIWIGNKMVDEGMAIDGRKRAEGNLGLYGG